MAPRLGRVARVTIRRVRVAESARLRAARRLALCCVVQPPDNSGMHRYPEARVQAGGGRQRPVGEVLVADDVVEAREAGLRAPVPGHRVQAGEHASAVVCGRLQQRVPILADVLRRVESRPNLVDLGARADHAARVAHQVQHVHAVAAHELRDDRQLAAVDANHLDGDVPTPARAPHLLVPQRGGETRLSLAVRVPLEGGAEHQRQRRLAGAVADARLLDGEPQLAAEEPGEETRAGRHRPVVGVLVAEQLQRLENVVEAGMLVEQLADEAGARPAGGEDEHLPAGGARHAAEATPVGWCRRRGDRPAARPVRPGRRQRARWADHVRERGRVGA